MVQMDTQRELKSQRSTGMVAAAGLIDGIITMQAHRDLCKAPAVLKEPNGYLRSILTGVHPIIFASSAVSHTAFYGDGASSLVAGFWRHTVWNNALLARISIYVVVILRAEGK